MGDTYVWDSYAELAAHYFVTGRFAALSGYVPLCGNLMHHAFELLLKAGLMKDVAVQIGAKPPFLRRVSRALQSLLKCRVPKRSAPQTVEDVLKFKYSHRLRHLWRDFKRCHPTEDLSTFDDLMSNLDRWEEIRYPRRGIVMSVQMTASHSPGSVSGPSAKATRPVYQMNIELLDMCIQRLWLVIGLNPEIFQMVIAPAGKTRGASVYEDDNTHLIYF